MNETDAMTSDTNRLDWLNGWPLTGATVLMGTGMYCAGCGADRGVTCVAFPEDWEPPGATPAWPFPEDNCAVCLSDYQRSERRELVKDREGNWATGKPLGLNPRRLP